MTVDYDMVLWAQTLLVRTRLPSDYELVRAYRVLIEVNPWAYRARLVEALMSCGWRCGLAERGAFFQDAVVVAEAMDADEPGRAGVLMNALHSLQIHLYEVGLRAEGLAVRAEMAALCRETGGDRGLTVWAYALAEEGRCAEAAEVLAGLVRPESDTDNGAGAWLRLSLAGALCGAGRADSAANVLAEMAATDRRRLAAGKTSIGGLFLLLNWLAVVLDQAARPAEADAARHEALGLARQLAATGEPKNWSGYQWSYAEVVLAAQAMDAEQVVPGEPRPPFGTSAAEWSRDMRARYVESHTNLAELARSEPHSAQATAIWRQHAIRTAVSNLWRRSHMFREPTLPAFDTSVEAARRAGSAALARALTDRALIRVTAHHYTDGLTDYLTALDTRTRAEA